MKTPRISRKGTWLVLAVDDEADHLTAYEVAFGRERNLRLITASGTRKAETILAEHNIDAVLLDLALPEESGLAFCRRIKAEARFRHLPVIALSALPAELFAAAALEAGCSLFLQKPCSLARIVAEVRDRLGCGSAGASPASLT